MQIWLYLPHWIRENGLTELTLSDIEVADGSFWLIFIQTHRQDLPLKNCQLPDQKDLFHERKKWYNIKILLNNSQRDTLGSRDGNLSPLVAVWGACRRPPLHWPPAAARPGEFESAGPTHSSFSARSRNLNPIPPPTACSVGAEGRHRPAACRKRRNIQPRAVWPSAGWNLRRTVNKLVGMGTSFAQNELKSANVPSNQLKAG